MPRKAKYMLAIEDEVDKACRRVKRKGRCFRSECDTRQVLIDPMLLALGWDIYNRYEVYEEYPTGGGRVDYALFVPESDAPVVLVEAKRVGSIFDVAFARNMKTQNPDTIQNWKWPPSTIRQLGGYCSRRRCGYGVLTDGVFWEIYDLSMRVRRFNNKRKCNFCIVNSTLEESVEKLSLLHRRNVLKKLKESKP